MNILKFPNRFESAMKEHEFKIINKLTVKKTSIKVTSGNRRE